ncbi:unnamed protein product, partial [Ectocarpus fasciculatus]
SIRHSGNCQPVTRMSQLERGGGGGGGGGGTHPQTTVLLAVSVACLIKFKPKPSFSASGDRLSYCLLCRSVYFFLTDLSMLSASGLNVSASNTLPLVGPL